MANEKRARMTPRERAKQFMPFSALRGLEEALAEKERIFEQRREVSEETARLINERLTALRRGNAVTVTHYRGGEYVITKGTVSAVDCVFKTLVLDTAKIAFEDITDIEI